MTAACGGIVTINPAPPARGRSARRSASRDRSACRNRASARAGPRETLRIENLRQPPQPDQPVHRRREIDPAERQLGRQMHAAARAPPRPAPRPDRSRTFAAKSWSMVTMTSGFHSSTCSIETLARPPRVPPATLLRQELDGLDIDRAAEPGLEPARPARVVDARPLLARESRRCGSVMVVIVSSA